MYAAVLCSVVQKNKYTQLFSALLYRGVNIHSCSFCIDVQRTEHITRFSSSVDILMQTGVLCIGRAQAKD